jgi:hypothetical protein
MRRPGASKQTNDPATSDGATMFLSEDERRERRETSRRRAAWGGFLSEYVWDHFATFTFATPTSGDAARLEFAHRYVRRLARVAQAGIAWALVVEGEESDHVHLHALLAGTRHLPTRELERAWKLGHTRVAIYDPQRGAATYLAKTLGQRGDNCELSRRRAPRLPLPASIDAAPAA